MNVSDERGNEMKARIVPLKFAEMNEREEAEYAEQLAQLEEMYREEAEFLAPVTLGEALPQEVDAAVFPKMIYAAFRHDEEMKAIERPMVVLTSQYGTIEMWVWEIVTYLRDGGCRVLAPYSVEMAKVILRALGVQAKLLQGAKFLLFQDTPGEGKQAYIFKKFYWWEQQSIRSMEETFGCRLIYRSWKELNEQAGRIPLEEAEKVCREWKICSREVKEEDLQRSARIYLAVKQVIDELGGVEGVGANCLNESAFSDTTPCLAWNMLFERDRIIWACEADTLSLLSTFIIYNTLQKPVMMTNLYPFLMGMAALAHERIKSFPEIEEPDKHALGVHCGYFGMMPREFCTEWTLRPRVLEIVNEHACAVDCRMKEGPVTLAKIYPGFRKLSLIRAELEGYVQYPGSDCLNGALIRYQDGYRVMEELCSHHSLIIEGECIPQLRQVAKIFGWEVVEM